MNLDSTSLKAELWHRLRRDGADKTVEWFNRKTPEEQEYLREYMGQYAEAFGRVMDTFWKGLADACDVLRQASSAGTPTPR